MSHFCKTWLNFWEKEGQVVRIWFQRQWVLTIWLLLKYDTQELMKGKFGCYEPFLQKWLNFWEKERQVVRIWFQRQWVLTIWLLLKYDIRKLMKGKFDCHEPLLQKIAEFLRERGTFSWTPFWGFKRGVFRTSSTFQTDRNLPISIKRFTKFFIFLSAEKVMFLPMPFYFRTQFL